MKYKTILIATDLGEHSPILLEKAQGLAEATGGGDKAQLHIVHVVQPLVSSLGSDAMFDFSHAQRDLFQSARAQLDAQAVGAGIPPERRYLLAGRPEEAIPKCVDDSGADLLIAGNTDRSGFAKIFFSTSAGLVRNLKCDSLFVSFADEQQTSN